MQYNDIDLVKALSEGSREAFTLLHERYFYEMLNFARSLLNNNEDIEDACADVFTKLWLVRDRFSDIKNIRAFLYTSMRNRCIDVLRRKKAVHEIPEDFVLLADPARNPEELAVIKQEYKHLILTQIEALPRQCKTIIKYSYVDHLQDEEISSILNVSPKTIKNQKSRGLNFLRSLASLDGSLPFFLIFLDLLKFIF